MNETITVSIVEDERSSREALSLLLNGTAGFRCVSSFRTAEEALRLIPQKPPAVALVDLMLPGISGAECVQRLRTLLPELRIVVLTKYEDAEKIFDALKAGANGYILKKTPPAELIEAITDVCTGGAPMSSEVAARVVAYFHRQKEQVSDLSTLTPREREILNFLAKGYRYREIAQELMISLSTVRVHLRHVYEKLHVRSRTEAVVKFLQQ